MLNLRGRFLTPEDTQSDADTTRIGNVAERKAWMTALETRFEQAQPNLNTSRSNLIRDILENAEDTYFLSSRALAKRYNIDKATIVRSVQILGYKKYAEFAADLRSHSSAASRPTSS